MANLNKHTIEQFQIVKQIGKGNFGTVYEAVVKSTSLHVAIKIIEKKHLDRKEEELIRNEIEILREINSHPNIVQYICAFEDVHFHYIVTELCVIDLDRKLKLDRTFFRLGRVKLFMKQIVSGLNYLKESYGIIHRDIKLSNLLLDKNDNVKIADFGMAVHYISGKQNVTFCGTPSYMSRERVLHQPHGYEADIWSLGCVLYVMLVGKSAFGEESVEKTFEKIARGDLVIPDDISCDASDLIKCLIEPNKEKRIKLHDVLKHGFFADAVEFKQDNQKNYVTPNRMVSQMSGYSGQSSENMTQSDFQGSYRSKPHQPLSDKSRGRHHALRSSELSNKLPPDRSKPPSSYTSTKYRGSKRSHSAEPLTHGNVPHNLSLPKVSDSCMDASKSRNSNTKGVSRFNCARIKYTRKRLKFGMLTITKVPGSERQANEVYFEIAKEDNRVSEVMKISEDGTEVSVFQLGYPCLLEDRPIISPLSSQHHYRFDNLPDHLRKYYRYVAKLIDLLQSMTPKVTIYNSEAKCIIMENLNYKAEFYDGTVVEIDSTNTKLIPAQGGELKNVESLRPNLSKEMLNKWESALKMQRLLVAEEADLRKKERCLGCILFPATYGSRPRPNIAPKTEPINPNIKSESPLPINSGGSIRLRSQDSGFLSNKSNSTRNSSCSKQSSNRGRNSPSTCVEIPDVGKAMKITDQGVQKIEVQTPDGYKFLVNCDTNSLSVTSPDGRSQTEECFDMAQKVFASLKNFYRQNDVVWQNCH